MTIELEMALSLMPTDYQHLHMADAVDHSGAKPAEQMLHMFATLGTFHPCIHGIKIRLVYDDFTEAAMLK